MTLATSWNIAWALNILIWECAECSKLAPTAHHHHCHQNHHDVVRDIGDVHRSKPPPTVHYQKAMRDIDDLMQVFASHQPPQKSHFNWEGVNKLNKSGKEWPEDFEEDLRTTALPTADLAADLTTQVGLAKSSSLYLYLFICLSDLNSFCSFVCVSLKSIANSTPTIRWISSVDYSTFLDIGKASFFNFSKYFFIFSDQGFNRCTSSSRFIPLSPTLSILTSLRGHFVILIDEDVILVQFYLSVHVRNGDFDAIEFD